MNKLFEQLREHWGRLSGGHKASLIAAMILVPALIVALTVYSNRPTWEPLPWQHLDQQGMANIVGFLDSNGFEYATEGNLVKVPKGEKYKILAALGQAGVDFGDTSGWDMLGTMNLSMSAKQLDLTTLRIYQKWIESTLRAYDFLSDASVVLTPGEEIIFSIDKERKMAKASVMATTRMGMRLTQSQAQAIVNVVAGAVAGLDPSRVSVQDRSGFVYRNGNKLDEDLPGWGMASAGLGLDKQQSKHFTGLLNDHLQNIFGPGKTTSSVTVVFDHTQSMEQSKIFDPDGSVVSKKTERKEETSTPESAGPVGSAPNLPASGSPGTPAASPKENKSNQTVKDTEYLTSETSTKTLLAHPEYKQVHVAVAADPSLALDDPTSGETPTAEQIQVLEENLRDLVRGVVPQVNTSDEEGIHIVIRRIVQPSTTSEVSGAPSILSSPWMELWDHGVEILVAITALVMLASMLKRARRRAQETRKNIEELRRPEPPPPMSPEAEARVEAESILSSNPEAASRVLREWARAGG